MGSGDSGGDGVSIKNLMERGGKVNTIEPEQVIPRKGNRTRQQSLEEPNGGKR